MYHTLLHSTRVKLLLDYDWDTAGRESCCQIPPGSSDSNTSESSRAKEDKDTLRQRGIGRHPNSLNNIPMLVNNNYGLVGQLAGGDAAVSSRPAALTKEAAP